VYDLQLVARELRVREEGCMKDLIANAAATVAAQARAAAADPLAVVAANPVRTLVQRHATADPSKACLRTFLRAEIGAEWLARLIRERLEIYPFHGELEELRASHERRALALRGRLGGGEIQARGLVPRLQRVIARAALLASERTALRWLQGREALLLRVYRGHHPQLDDEGRRLLADGLLAEQERMDRVVAGLARKL
jgi:hypothetical protein